LVAFYFYRKGEVLGSVAAAACEMDELIFIWGKFSTVGLGPLSALRMGVGEPAIISRGASAVCNQVRIIDKAKA
jgi:hypothetical protein